VGRFDVIVVGAAARDTTTEDPRGWRLGGGVTYGALALARLGLSAAAVIGLDAAAATAPELGLLERAGVSLAPVPLGRGPVFHNEERPSGRVQTCLSLSDAVPPEAVPTAWREAPAWLIAPVAGEVGDGWAALPPRESCVALAWQGLLRRLVPGERVTPLRPGPSNLLRRADLVAVSRHDLPHDLELRVIGGWLRPAAELLLTAGPEGGLLLRYGGGRLLGGRTYPSVPSRVELDPTGAGDTMLSGLLAARVAGGRALRSSGADLRIGAAAASLLVERPGLDAVPTLRELAGRIAAGH
jgi:sugar/nucleoside kinase (ribokinase family)